MTTSVRYISGGLLGDFIHQLSVIHETYLTTGRRGILYLSDHVGDRFKYGATRAYMDISSILQQQPAIESVSVHAGESYDINLSQWRSSPLVFRANWNIIYKTTYGADWGRHAWLTLPAVARNSTDRILVNISYQYGHRIPTYNLPSLFSQYPSEQLHFLCQDRKEYEAFEKATGVHMNCLVAGSLEELCVHIQGCKLFIGNLSSPLALAHAMHIPNITLVHKGACDTPHMIGLETLYPSMQILGT